MKSSWFTALMLSLALAITPALSDAKRLGSGKSSGMQRDMPARTAPDAPPAKPATPAQASPTAPAAAAAPGAAAAAGKRSWLGPIAGIAAGLGLAALMSHLGLGDEFASFLLIALLVVAGIFLARWLMRRGRPQQPALAGAGAGAPMQRSAEAAWGAQQPAAPAGAATPAPLPMPAEPAARPAAAFVPATFDSESFERIAKTIFVRLQAANDAGDLDDLRRFTTPEMFAELKMDLQDRGTTGQHTDVLHVDAKVLDVAEEDGRQIVSVRYNGRVREAEGAEPVDFDEVWHLVKPVGDDSRGWAIAGIEQLNPAG